METSFGFDSWPDFHHNENQQGGQINWRYPLWPEGFASLGWNGPGNSELAIRHQEQTDPVYIRVPWLRKRDGGLWFHPRGYQESLSMPTIVGFWELLRMKTSTFLFHSGCVALSVLIRTIK